jgi:hypothetical protein
MTDFALPLPAPSAPTARVAWHLRLAHHLRVHSRLRRRLRFRSMWRPIGAAHDWMLALPQSRP